MAIPTLDAAAQAEGLLPFRGDCPRCWAEVLVVEIRGADVVVEVDEVLETFTCPQCRSVASHGGERGLCLRCDNTGSVGEPLPPFGVAVDADGVARYFVGGRPAEGEGIYAEHLCR